MFWRRWSSKQCDKTEMIEETKEVALVIEGPLPVSVEKVQ